MSELYIQYSETGVAQTTELIPGIVFADLDAEGKIVGLEVLAPGEAVITKNECDSPYSYRIHFEPENLLN